MRIKEFPGGWYCDALPSGEYAVIFPGSPEIQTHLGPISHLNGWLPYFVRCSKVKEGFEFAGQSNGSYTTLRWNNGWKDIAQTPCGESPVIYDNLGNLHISDCSIGSQGWRFVDYYTGRLWTGDEAYSYPPGRILRYCYLGDDLYFGQGDQGDAILWDGKVRRTLYKGAPFTLKFNRMGEDVAISFYLGTALSTAVIIWATMDELRNLPIAIDPPVEVPKPEPLPDPEPKPIPVPEPLPEPVPVPVPIPEPIPAPGNGDETKPEPMPVPEPAPLPEKPNGSKKEEIIAIGLLGFSLFKWGKKLFKKLRGKK